MQSRWVTALGFVWPLIVAVNATVVCYLVHPQWYHLERGMLAVVACSFLAAPVLGRSFYRELPTRWPRLLRTVAAILLAVPVVGVVTYVALFAFIMATLPLGWIG
jgi:hypothetical protein